MYLPEKEILNAVVTLSCLVTPFRLLNEMVMPFIRSLNLIQPACYI